MKVIGVSAREAYPAILESHYAHRLPSITHAFGLFDGSLPIGYVTYGTPSSAPLRDGIAGSSNASMVLELNRLIILHDVRNGASMLVGGSLRQLPRPSIVVSYADCAQGHIGYVYQACNFTYTGLSAKRTDWKLKGHDDLHGQSIADMSRHVAGTGKGARAKYMRERFGDDFYLEERSRKHRYIFVCGNKSEKSRIWGKILYQPEPFPKGETMRYQMNKPTSVQPQLFGNLA